jgi:CO/xanthine dehydrogenase FAD-binding subunit
MFGSQGLRTVPFQSVFHGRMRLKPSEVVVQVHVPGWALKAPLFHVKHTTNEKIDYPLVTAAALWKDGNMRIAFSGLCSYPFRSAKIEEPF